MKLELPYVQEKALVKVSPAILGTFSLTGLNAGPWMTFRQIDTPTFKADACDRAAEVVCASVQGEGLAGGGSGERR